MRAWRGSMPELIPRTEIPIQKPGTRRVEQTWRDSSDRRKYIDIVYIMRSSAVIPTRTADHGLSSFCPLLERQKRSFWSNPRDKLYCIDLLNTGDYERSAR